MPIISNCLMSLTGTDLLPNADQGPDQTNGCSRKLVSYGNMLYVGIVGQVLRIPLEDLHYTIYDHFSSKPKIAESNFNMVKLGYEYAAENLEKKDRFETKKLAPMEGYILTDGNNVVV